MEAGPPVEYAHFDADEKLEFLRDQRDYKANLAAACNPSSIRELLAYVDSLEKDAARYRWLRDPANANRDEWNSFGPYSSPQEIDAAIDAAMEQTK